MKTTTGPSLTYLGTVNVHLLHMVAHTCNAKNENTDYGTDYDALMETLKERQEAIMEGAERPDWDQLRRLIREALRVCLGHLESGKLLDAAEATQPERPTNPAEIVFGCDDEDTMSIAEQVALNAGLCLAWNCKSLALADGYCSQHQRSEP